MQTITINIKNKEIRDKIMWFLKHLESEGVEITSQEDIEDLKLLAATREEESILFSEYLENEN